MGLHQVNNQNTGLVKTKQNQTKNKRTPQTNKQKTLTKTTNPPRSSIQVPGVKLNLQSCPENTKCLIIRF